MVGLFRFGVAQLAVALLWRFAEWSTQTTLRAGLRLVNAANSGQSAGELLQSLADDAREATARALGVVDVAQEAVTPATDAPSLREKGAELLRRSADVAADDGGHPAYARILDEMAPDEARILRRLCDGPQPAVDVRSSGKVPIGASQLVAPGLTMIGREAGLRHTERLPSYLANLFRLGLIWFSREPLADPLEYQVLEAQPEVLEAMRKHGRGKTVRRSIRLTPFGSGFCAAVIPRDSPEVRAIKVGEAEVQPGTPTIDSTATTIEHTAIDAPQLNAPQPRRVRPRPRPT